VNYHRAYHFVTRAGKADRTFILLFAKSESGFEEGFCEDWQRGLSLTHVMGILDRRRARAFPTDLSFNNVRGSGSKPGWLT